MAQVYDKMIVDVKVKRDSIITAVQNDANSRFLDVYLKDNGLPINLTGHEVRIYCRKPEDGGEIYNNGVITEASNGRCQFPITDQTLAKVGYVEAQIMIYYQNVQILQTMEFKIHVVKSLFSKNSVQSSNEYGALVVLYHNLYEAHNLMTTMVQNIGVPGEIAQQLTIDTMWDAWEYLCNYVSEDLTTLLQNAINNNSVDGVMQRLGNATDTGATTTVGTVMGKLNTLLGGIGVKKIQQGVVQLGFYESSKTVAISTVNASKSLLLLTPISVTKGVMTSAYLQSNGIVLSGNDGIDKPVFYWTVVEFN